MATDSVRISRTRPRSLGDWLEVARIAGVLIVRIMALAVAVFLLAKVRSSSSIPVHVVVSMIALGCVYIALGSGFRVWAFYIVGFVAFAQLRSYTDDLGMPVQYDYAIVAEKVLFLGHLPNHFLQDWFYVQDRLGALELYTITVYLAYFFAPHVVAIALWKADRGRFNRYVAAFLITLYIGLLTSAVLPTAPPWLAGQEGVIAPVSQILPDISGEYAPGAYGRAYEVAGANPVAAMPSLHSAVPFVMMFALWKYRHVRVVGVWYAVSMPLAVVYLGEHYFVDALAGLAAAAAGWWAGGVVVERVNAWAERQRQAGVTRREAAEAAAAEPAAGA